MPFGWVEQLKVKISIGIQKKKTSVQLSIRDNSKVGLLLSCITGCKVFNENIGGKYQMCNCLMLKRHMNLISVCF